MAVEQGFTKAQTDILPNISEDMIINFFKENLDFLSAEMKGIKAERSTRGSYADNAVGYVQLRRVGSTCEVKARITPEHNTRKKAYVVSLQCNEATRTIVSVTCDGCAAHKGGCKHAVAFLFWVHRQCSLPSTTETQCYWKKSALSTVGSSVKIVYASKMGTKEVKSLPPKDPQIVQAMMRKLNEQNVNDIQISAIFKVSDNKKHLSLHILKMNFNHENLPQDPETFLSYLGSTMTEDMCKRAEAASVTQSRSSDWHELRYGRITASKVYEASRCTTLSGSLVESILGAKFRLNTVMKRGSLLEADVIKELRKSHKVQIFPSGFITSPKFPFAGASPDGLSQEFVVEVKCPSSTSTMEKYFTNGLPSNKHLAQIQLQMLFAKKKKGSFLCCPSRFRNYQAYH